jgi:hypothetical protein
MAGTVVRVQAKLPSRLEIIRFFMVIKFLKKLIEEIKMVKK